jgi:hypothetical protein
VRVRFSILIPLALVLEVGLQILFWSDASNFDCGGPCSTESQVLGAAAFWIVPAAIVVLLVGAVIARRRRHNG